MKVRLCWNHPGPLHAAASHLRAITDATGLALPFRLWCSIMVSTAYWQRVRAHGLTLESLGNLVGRRLPILCFHSISSVQPARWKYHLEPERFQNFLVRLRASGYTFVLPEDNAAAKREIALTFDDGYEDFYFEVFPKMEMLVLKPVVFVVVDRIGQTNVWDQVTSAPAKRLLSLNQIREMSRYGVHFGSHSMTHACLTRLSDTELRQEVADSKAALQDKLGTDVSIFAYPYGAHDERVRAAVAEAGYKQAFSTRSGLHHWGDPLSINRLEIYSQDTWPEILLKLASGHSLRDDLSGLAITLVRTALRTLPRGLSSSLIHVIRKTRTSDYNAS
jgi:peptidoglycan/xylan/chitin deacetylase (PgdA/CDA1 family)